MPEYEQTLSVQASPDDVFDFISDINNLPKYLPTTHRAEKQSGDRVRVQGEAAGHPYDSDGYFRAEPTEHTLEWGSDGENSYSGWMEVEGVGETSEVIVHLSFQPKPDQERRFEEEMGSRDAAIQDGLRAALESIRNQVQGQGGKVEPAAAT